MPKSIKGISVVIPNWNGENTLSKCIDSLLNQTLKPNIIVVENGSTDGSLKLIQNKYPDVSLVINYKNLGFAGGVNSGIKVSIEQDDKYVALFNNDAIADNDWLKHLVDKMDNNPKAGIVTSKILSDDGKKIDSTGDMFTNWGLAFPRGRDEEASDKYDHLSEVFAGSGGASIYRIELLKEIGLFDEDFFAYYEDVDLSFRAQLIGWKVLYQPKAIVYHQIGATSKKIRGFTTYHSIKNLYWLTVKNVPKKYLFSVLVRLRFAQILFFLRAVTRGNGWSGFKGAWVSIFKTPKKIHERGKIQKSKKVSDEYIWSIITHDLPPNATALRKIRGYWWKLRGRHE